MKKNIIFLGLYLVIAISVLSYMGNPKLSDKYSPMFKSSLTQSIQKMEAQKAVIPANQNISKIGDIKSPDTTETFWPVDCGWTVCYNVSTCWWETCDYLTCRYQTCALLNTCHSGGPATCWYSETCHLYNTCETEPTCLQYSTCSNTCGTNYTCLQSYTCNGSDPNCGGDSIKMSSSYKNIEYKHFEENLIPM